MRKKVCPASFSHEIGKNLFISDLDVHRWSETMEPDGRFDLVYVEKQCGLT